MQPDLLANLKSEITALNASYRAGSPEVSDEQYDILLSKLQKSWQADE